MSNRRGPLSKAWSSIRSMFQKFAGVQDSPSRQSVERDLQSPDTKLDNKDRDKAISRSRDHQENFALVGWALRKHCDFVAEHVLHIKTSDQELNRDLEDAIAEESKKNNFDARGVHSRESFTRLVEASALVDGDIGIQKLKTGKVNAFESDRVRTPIKKEADKYSGIWVHGCLKNKDNQVTHYAVHKRGNRKNGFELERVVQAKKCFFHGHFQRFDQTRGISPFIVTMNEAQDLHESKSYALARAKLSQIMGFYLKRSGAKTSNMPDLSKGLFGIELDIDDSAGFIRDANPSNEWREFQEIVTAIALKANDIPFNFWRENFTNFFGAKSSLLLYLKSVVAKRRNLKDNFLNPWLEWKLTELRGRPEFRYLRNLDKVPFRFVALGTPWANPLQEVQASIQEIAMSLSSRQRKVMEIYGEDWFEIVDELAEEEKYLIEKGVPRVHPSSLVMSAIPPLDDQPVNGNNSAA